MGILDNTHDEGSFLPLLLSFVTPIIEKDFEDKELSKQISENMKRVLSGKKINSIKDRSTVYKEEKFLRVIMKHYTEISSSLERMGAISIFIRQYPRYKSFDKYQITPTLVLKYHAENYLSEIYLFKERFSNFIGFLKNECNNKRLYNEKIKLDKIRDLLTTTIDGLIHLRGAHVHKTRYTDDKFDQLDLYELLTKKGKDQFLDGLKKINYRSIRNEWHTTIEKNNLILDSITGQALELLKVIVFEKMLPHYK